MRATWKQLAPKISAAKIPDPSTASPEQPPDESLYTVSPGLAPPSGLAWVWLPGLVMLPRMTLGHALAVTSLSLQFLICKLEQEVPPGGLPMKVNRDSGRGPDPWQQAHVQCPGPSWAAPHSWNEGLGAGVGEE